MKKFISALLAAVAVTALSCVFVSAKETNVALHKPWSGIEVPTNEGANVYTGDFTDGVYAAEGDEFSYKEPWFTFYTNDQNDASWTNLTDRVGKVDIELGDAGTNITNHIERKTSDVRTQDYRNPRHRRRDPEGNVIQGAHGAAA